MISNVSYNLFFINHPIIGRYKVGFKNNCASTKLTSYHIIRSNNRVWEMQARALAWRPWSSTQVRESNKMFDGKHRLRLSDPVQLSRYMGRAVCCSGARWLSQYTSLPQVGTAQKQLKLTRKSLLASCFILTHAFSILEKVQRAQNCSCMSFVSDIFLRKVYGNMQVYIKYN